MDKREIVGLLTEILEGHARTNRTVIIFDPDSAREDVSKHIEDLRNSVTNTTEILPIGRAYCNDLYIFVPPDQLARYEAGFPIAVSPVWREQRSENPRHRPVDAHTVAEAKGALKIEAFRLTGRQTAVEMANNNRHLNLTADGARDRAMAKVATAIPRENDDPDGQKRAARLRSLIDRGRRIAARFFGTRKPSDRLHVEERDVTTWVEAEGRAVLPELEADNLSRVQAMSSHVDRARDFEAGMYGWNETVRLGGPISHADGQKLTNAVEERMTAPELMKVAISGDLDPTLVQGNFKAYAGHFEVGRLLGRLDRHQAVEITPEAAGIIKEAIATVRRGQCETHADTCDRFLVEAAGKRGTVEFWEPLLDRVISTGVSEMVEPNN